MNKEKKGILLMKISDAEARLERAADGQHEIGNLAIAVSQLADVLKEVVAELSSTSATAKMCEAVLDRML